MRFSNDFFNILGGRITLAEETARIPDGRENAISRSLLLWLAPRAKDQAILSAVVTKQDYIQVFCLNRAYQN